jgi:hypothetical protein
MQTKIDVLSPQNPILFCQKIMLRYYLFWWQNSINRWNAPEIKGNSQCAKKD